MKVAYVRCTEIYNDSRATKEIFALAEAGYQVEVIGWDRNGKAAEECGKCFGTIDQSLSFHFFKKAMPNGIGIKNIGKLFQWFRFIKKELKAINDLSAVHACDLDCGFASYSFCKKRKLPLIYDIYDYYVDSHAIPSFAANFVEKQEIKVINYASITIICTEERREQIAKAAPKRVIVIHNTPEIKDSEDKSCETEYDYIYCGGLNSARMIDRIFDEYPLHSNIRMCFAGGGLLQKKAEELASEYETFTYLGSIPYNSVLENERKAICMSAIYDPSKRNHRLCAPNKFYEALALGKPIIVCKGTGIDKIVEDNRIGISIGFDVNEFYDALEFFKSHSEDRKEMSYRAKKLYFDKYDWQFMKEILIKAYSEEVAHEA